MFALSALVLGLTLSLLTFFAKEDRAEIKARVEASATKATNNEREIALLKLSLATMKADLDELKSGQREMLARLPRK
jgi:hypothetical protein